MWSLSPKSLMMVDDGFPETRSPGPARLVGPSRRAAPSRIALLGNSLPRRCGIATFTTHVYDALLSLDEPPRVDLYAMVDPGQHYDFPSSVTSSIDQEDRPGYRRAAQRISDSTVDAPWVQHEYGIFGGTAGEYLFDLLDAVPTPVIATLHTVLEAPTPPQARVLRRLAERASLLIVMAERARSMLREIYNVPASKITVIEHGVPERAYLAPSVARRRLGIEDRKTIMTFGLLSPDKGIETMVRAMPEILQRCPDAVYRVAGATHPHLLAAHGESYRHSLQELARDLGVEAHLRWDNRFFDEDELLDQLATADVYVTPYRNPQQITSGALSYAAALGKPIVATRYIHATELLASDRGLLIGYDDAAALAAAVGDLLIDDPRRERLARTIYVHSRQFLWRRMAARVWTHIAHVTSSSPSTQSRAEARLAPQGGARHLGAPGPRRIGEAPASAARASGASHSSQVLVALAAERSRQRGGSVRNAMSGEADSLTL